MSDEPRPFGIEHWIAEPRRDAATKALGPTIEKLVADRRPLSELIRQQMFLARRELLVPHIAACLSGEWSGVRAEAQRIVAELSDEQVCEALRDLARAMAEGDTGCPECGREYDE